jgi:leucyl-tRNA synthetase
LAQLEDWVKVSCPRCGGPARRETDVSDTFLDSAWYFFRYPSVSFDDRPFDKKLTSKWLPVEMYIGGPEHTVLHLMYSRFITMAFKDFGLIDFEEPYKKFYAHGFITKDGAKMSKSKGNVVVPDEYIKAYGADTLRMYLMFMGPFDRGGDFSDAGIEGITRFLKKVWNLVQSQDVAATHASPVATPTAVGANRHLHRLIKKVGEDIENMKFNTAIAAMMEFLNDVVANFSSRLSTEEWGVFLRLLAPFAPHITEELWQCLSGDVVANFSSRSSIHLQPWPNFDSKLLEEEEVTIIVQVDGKVRGRLEVKKGIARAKLRKLAEQQPNVTKFISERAVKKAYVVDDRLINFATEPNP